MKKGISIWSFAGGTLEENMKDMVLAQLSQIKVLNLLAKQEQIDARAEIEAIQADFNAELNEIKAIVNSYNAESEALQDAIDSKLEAIKPKINALDCGKYTVDGADRQINVLMKENSVISADAIAELSEAELRKSYKLTESGLKDLGRKDLINKYKTTSEVKSFRVEKLK